MAITENKTDLFSATFDLTVVLRYADAGISKHACVMVLSLAIIIQLLKIE